MKRLALFIGLLLMPVVAISADGQGVSGPPLQSDDAGLTPARISELRHAMFHAIRMQDEHALMDVIAAGADVNATDDPVGWTGGDSGYDALHFAIPKSPVWIINDLIAAGADVNAVDRHGNTPLRIADLVHRPEIIDVLTAAGAVTQPKRQTVHEKMSELQTLAEIKQEEHSQSIQVAPPPPPPQLTPPEALSIAVAPIFQTQNEDVRIVGRVLGAGRIASLTVDGSGVPVGPDGSFDFQRMVTIGATELQLQAKSEWNQLVEAKIKVIRSVPAPSAVEFAPLDPAHLHGTSSPEAIALIVGIERYANAPPADFAENDANAFYDYATKALGVPPDRVKLLVICSCCPMMGIVPCLPIHPFAGRKSSTPLSTRARPRPPCFWTPAIPVEPGARTL